MLIAETKPLVSKVLALAPGGLPYPAAFREAAERLQDGLFTASVPWPEELEERLVHCRGCLQAVTSSAHEIQVSGRHHHTFPNPLGIVFEIGCYARAGGCLHRGPSTGDFSWFSGFSWCFALCAGCSAHLGWHYSSSTTNFYGLIMANLLIKD